MKCEPKRVGGRCRGLDSGNRRFKWIDRVVLVFHRILDGAPDQPRVRRDANGLRNIFRFIAETVLEVSRNWQISRADNCCCVGQRLVTGKCGRSAGQSCPQIRRSMLQAPC
ncbi:MAG: hypothetical protein VXX79_13100, partial [Pseudomonadota bacterium]|nr:hypothetical protein [Pseudomonadota bacterium]